MSTSILRRLSAAVGVLALSAAASFVAVAPASAVTLPGNINADQPVSLTIHKSILNSTSPLLPGTGQELPAAGRPGPPLPGATFTVALVPGIDLTTPQGWTQANALTAAQAATRVSAANTFTEITDAQGLAVFDDPTLDIGVYLVTETDAPDGVTDLADPFLVTLPYPTGTAGSPSNQWIYDVHAYPKNATTAVTKGRLDAVDGSAEARNPDLIRWEIESDIPQLAAGGTISTYSLTDNLPAGLDYVAVPPTGVTESRVLVTDANGNAQNFVAGTDYNIVLAPDGRSVTATITSAGRTRLAGFPGGEVTFEVLTRAVSVPANGVITNSATTVVNGSTDTVTGTTAMGQLTIFAYAIGGRAPLAGAQYQVYLSQTDADLSQNPITVNGAVTFTPTTGPNGLVLLPALTVDSYFVREVTPPAGYNLPTIPIATAAVTAGTTSTVPGAFKNYVEFGHNQVPAFALPLTGGDGALWFTVGGIGLISIALGTGIVASRRRRATTALVDA